MILADELKILHSKIKAIQALYDLDLDRKTARIYALSSITLYKDECLTGDDLDYKPS